MRNKMTRIAAVLAMLAGVVVAEHGVEARQPADVAAKLSGTWVLNRELSTGFGASGRGRGRGTPPGLQRPGSPTGALFAVAGIPQRGGGRGGGAATDSTDLTPEQRAEQAAMRELEQIADRITIKASADSITFVDPRGERTYAINDKGSSITVGGTSVKVKSKWDKKVLRQEFNNPQAKLTQTWGLDDAGHMVLTMKVESLTLVTPDQKAVFDRQ
jgi:uncharacterized protein YnzC (UPF0291/DUF896 family)